jgi:glycosyltransferase domain-containing protein
MKEAVTILIPTHNRHPYLGRILDYYDKSGLPVIVADSTPTAFFFEGNRQDCYLHLPGVNLSAKLDLALQKVRTPYVVICADDDFLIIDGVAVCVDFLQRHEDFVAAQGNSINYRLDGARIDFRVMYPELSLEISMDKAFDRLERMFGDYKSFFYAVYRTAQLKTAFRHLGQTISNLYLNEYVTGIIPLAWGKYIELPVFYQVREYSESSDDKRTPNLDRIFFDNAYVNEREAWLDFLATAVYGITAGDRAGDHVGDRSVVREKLSDLLLDFARRLQHQGPVLPTRKKKIGSLVAAIPFIGGYLVKYNRRREIAAQLKKIIKTPEDRRQLAVIASFIKKYAHAIR